MTIYPNSHVVITTKLRGVADEISTCLNSFGRWDSVVVPSGLKWMVMLPGQDSPEIKTYMHGFLDGWLTSSRLFSDKLKASGGI